MTGINILDQLLSAAMDNGQLTDEQYEAAYSALWGKPTQPTHYAVLNHESGRFRIVPALLVAGVFPHLEATSVAWAMKEYGQCDDGLHTAVPFDPSHTASIRDQ